MIKLNNPNFAQFVYLCKKCNLYYDKRDLIENNDGKVFCPNCKGGVYQEFDDGNEHYCEKCGLRFSSIRKPNDNKCPKCHKKLKIHIPVFDDHD